MRIIAVVQGDKIVERIVQNVHKDIERGKPGDDTQLKDITAKPWLKVGDYLGLDPTKWVPDQVEPTTPVNPVG